MKRVTWFFAILLMILFVWDQAAYAQQKVTLCENYTTSGQPIAPNTEWIMNPTGGAVYILYSNNGVPIGWPKLYVLIDQEVNGKYQEYATESFAPDQSKSWAVFDYAFHHKGNFRVRIADEQMNPLAEKYIEIRFSEEQSEGATNEPSISFCLSLDENLNPADVGESFYINREEGSYIYIYIDNGSAAFGTEGLIVDLWKGEDYNEYVDTKNLTIESQWEATYFNYTFTTPGDYKIMVYRKDNISHIVSGYVSIKYK
jgi:hypothetical protein